MSTSIQDVARIKELLARVEALEKRVLELEARKTLSLPQGMKRTERT